MKRSDRGCIVASLLWLCAPLASAEDPDVTASPVVRACVDRDGKLLSASIAKSSGRAAIDEAALAVARNARFSPGETTGSIKKRPRKSCLNFKVKFVLEDGKPVLLEGPPVQAAA